MYDMLTIVEGEIALAVAVNVNSVLRRILHDTVTVAAGEIVPNVGAGGGRVLGDWGQVVDAATGIELTTNLNEDEIRAIVSAPSIFRGDYYSYIYRSPRIYPTVEGVIIDVCTFDQAGRQAAIKANEDLLFQQCEGAYFNGLMSNLKNEDPLLQSLSNQFTSPYQMWLDRLASSPADMVKESAA